jgi:hypothetical protein
MATRGVHIETKIVFETRISMWTRSRRIKMQRCIVTSCERAFVFTPLRQLILTWHFSWHHEEMKEDALQKGLPVPDEAAVQDQVLKKHVDAPDLATVKDFLRFYAATSKGKIREKISCDSLNTFAEWFFAGFSRVTDTPINDNDRSEVYNVSTLRHICRARSHCR